MTNIAFAMLNARRTWYVPEVAVSGDYSAVQSHMLVSEIENGTRRVVLYRYGIGGHVQEVRFDSLIDHRGNTLPGAILQPVVIPIPRGDVPVSVVGRPSDTFCQLARTEYSGSDGLVDLYIIELGRKGESS